MVRSRPMGNWRSLPIPKRFVIPRGCVHTDSSGGGARSRRSLRLESCGALHRLRHALAYPCTLTMRGAHCTAGDRP